MMVSKSLRARRRWIAPAILALFLGPPSVSGEEGGWLTLSHAVALALEQEPTLGAARARRSAAEAEMALAETERRPALSLTASTTRFQDPMVVTPIHGFTPEVAPQFDDTLIQAGLTGSYSLFEGGAREARIESSRHRVTAAAAGMEDREQAVAFAAAASYLDVLGLSRLLEAHQSRLTALAAEQKRVGQLIAVGRVAELELRRIEAALAAAEAERVRLVVAVDRAERRLARLLGVAVRECRSHRLREVRPSAEALPARELLTVEALAASPEVARTRAELAAAESAAALAASGRRPRLRVEASWLDFGSSEGDFTAEWQVGMRLGLPLLDGGATRERMAAAEARRVAASEEVRAAEQRVEEALDGALARMEESRARLASLEIAVGRSAEVSRIEQLKLETGVGTQPEFLDAEADLLGARAGVVHARLGTITAQLEIARVSGRLGAAWIAAHMEEGP